MSVSLNVVRAVASATVAVVMLAGPPTSAEEGAVRLGPITVESDATQGYGATDAGVGTRTPAPIMRTPSSVKVVPHQVLEDQGVIRLQDALSNASGILFTEGPEGLGFRSRGFPLQIFHDGVPRSELAGGDMEAHDMEVYNIERIEVLKGPASFLYGRGNPGGAINVVTKKPQATPAYEATLTFGAHELLRPSVDLTGPLDQAGQLLYRFNAVYETAGSFRDHVEGERTLVTPSLAWTPREGTRLWGSWEHVDIRFTPDSGVPAGTGGNYRPGLGREDFFGEPTDFRDQQQNQLRLGASQELAEGWSLNLSSSFIEGRNEQTYTRAGVLQSNGRTLTRTVRTDRVEYVANALDAYVSGELATGPIGHAVALGGSFHTIEGDPLFKTATAASIDVLNPVYGNTQPTGAFNVSDTLNERTLAGLYAEDRIQLGSQVTVVGGGRLDSYTAQSWTNDVPAPERKNTVFSPRLGVVYQPLRELSFYAGYAEAFQALNAALRADGTMVEPEKARLHEVGAKLSLFDDRLSGTFALYDILRDNISVADPDNPGFQIENGEQRSRGVELDVSGRILPGWKVIAGYSYTDAEITKNSNAAIVGKRPANVPTHTVALWSTYEFQSAALSGLGIGGGLRYIGERPAVDTGAISLDGYTLFDAVAYYQFARWRLQANIRNLFDTDYVTTRAGNFVFPGEPLTATLTARLRF